MSCSIRKKASLGLYLPSLILLNSSRFRSTVCSECTQRNRGPPRSAPPRCSFSWSSRYRAQRVSGLYRELLTGQRTYRCNDRRKPYPAVRASRPCHTIKRWSAHGIADTGIAGSAPVYAVIRTSFWKLSLEYVIFTGEKPSHRTISSIATKNFSSSASGFVSSYRK